jgi:hypothetical protein
VSCEKHTVVKLFFSEFLLPRQFYYCQGLFLNDKDESIEISENIEKSAVKRWVAKQPKNFAEADRIYVKSLEHWWNVSNSKKTHNLPIEKMHCFFVKRRNFQQSIVGQNIPVEYDKHGHLTRKGHFIFSQKWNFSAIVAFPKRSIPFVPKNGNLSAKYRHIEYFSQVRQL